MDNNVLLLQEDMVDIFSIFPFLFVIQKKFVQGETFLEIGDKTLIIVVEVTQISINLLFSFSCFFVSSLVRVQC